MSLLFSLVIIRLAGVIWFVEAVKWLIISMGYTTVQLPLVNDNNKHVEIRCRILVNALI